MRPLWPIERAVIDAAVQDYPSSAEVLKRQIESAHVIEFENTGAGFFSTLSIAAGTPLLPDKSPLNAAHGSVEGIQYGMGFLIFFESGRVSLIEGYSYGNDSTVGTDFEHVSFELKPWSKANE